MDRRLLDYNPESETFEAGTIKLRESEWRGATDTEAVFDEAAEMELAAGLLEAKSEGELDRFINDLIDRAGRAAGGVAQPAAQDALTGMLKAAAKRAVPVVARRVGSTLGAGTGVQVVRAAARYLGLELEGLSPEDQEFEAARRLVRFAGEAAKNAVTAPAGMPPEAAIARAARATHQGCSLSSVRQIEARDAIRRPAVVGCVATRTSLSSISDSPPADARVHFIQEDIMHDIDRTQLEYGQEMPGFQSEQFGYGETEWLGESVLSEADEIQLAGELLEVTTKPSSTAFSAI